MGFSSTQRSAGPSENISSSHSRSTPPRAIGPTKSATLSTVVPPSRSSVRRGLPPSTPLGQGRSHHPGAGRFPPRQVSIRSADTRASPWSRASLLSALQDGWPGCDYSTRLRTLWRPLRMAERSPLPAPPSASAPPLGSLLDPSDGHTLGVAARAPRRGEAGRILMSEQRRVRETTTRGVGKSASRHRVGGRLATPACPRGGRRSPLRAGLGPLSAR